MGHHIWPKGKKPESIMAAVMLISAGYAFFLIKNLIMGQEQAFWNQIYSIFGFTCMGVCRANVVYCRLSHRVWWLQKCKFASPQQTAAVMDLLVPYIHPCLLPHFPLHFEHTGRKGKHKHTRTRSLIIAQWSKKCCTPVLQEHDMFRWLKSKKLNCKDEFFFF